MEYPYFLDHNVLPTLVIMKEVYDKGGICSEKEGYVRNISELIQSHHTTFEIIIQVFLVATCVQNTLKSFTP